MECGMELASFPGCLPLCFLVAYVTFEPSSDKLAEGLVPLLRTSFTSKVDSQRE